MATIRVTAPPAAVKGVLNVIAVTVTAHIQMTTPRTHQTRHRPKPSDNLANVSSRSLPETHPQDGSSEGDRTCDGCNRELHEDQGWYCSICPDKDFCDECSEQQGKKSAVGCEGHDLKRSASAKKAEKRAKGKTNAATADATSSNAAAGEVDSGASGGFVENPTGGKRKPKIKLPGLKKKEVVEDEMPKATAAAAAGAGGGGKDISKILGPAFPPPPPPPSVPIPTKRQPKHKPIPPPKPRTKIGLSTSNLPPNPTTSTKIPPSLLHLEKAHTHLSRGNELTPAEIASACALEPVPAAGKPKARRQPLPGPQQEYLLALHKFKHLHYTAEERTAGNSLVIADPTGEFWTGILEAEKLAAKELKGEDGVEMEMASRPELAEEGVQEVVSEVRREICRGLAVVGMGKAVEALEGEKDVEEAAKEELLALVREVEGGGEA